MTTPTQEVNEAGFSTNIYLYHPEIGKVQFTFRGKAAADWKEVLTTEHEFMAHMRSEGWLYENEWLSSAKQQPSNDPEYVPVGEDGNPLPPIRTITADGLKVDMHDNKFYYKVLGKPFTKYGISVWPEVLEAAGLDVSDPTKPPNIAGWRADYIEKSKDGKTVPDKVTRLLPPV